MKIFVNWKGSGRFLSMILRETAYNALSRQVWGYDHRDFRCSESCSAILRGKIMPKTICTLYRFKIVFKIFIIFFLRGGEREGV